MANASTNTRRGVLKALPFIGATTAAPIIAEAAPRGLSARDIDAQIASHAEAIKKLSRGRTKVVELRGPYQHITPTKEEARSLAYWEGRFPPGDTYLLSGGSVVYLRFTMEADRPGAPMAWITLAGDPNVSERYLAQHLPSAIIGWVL